jgi:hypothetical protein
MSNDGLDAGRLWLSKSFVSDTFKFGEPQFTLSGRWFHEFDVTHRVRSDSIFVLLSFPL